MLAQRDPTKEILIFFKEGVSSEARTINGIASRVAKVKNESLRQALKNLDIQELNLEAAMPEFNRADTIRILPDGKIIRSSDMTNLFRFRVKENQDKQELIHRLQSLPEILDVHADGLTILDGVPNDPEFKGTLTIDGQKGQWALNETNNPEDINAVAAWDIFTGTAQNTIAIIDTGVDFSHPDFANKQNGGLSTFNTNGHGTMVAGIAAAIGNNGKGIAGIDWYAKIHSQRIDAQTGGESEAANSVRNSVNHSYNVHVLNCSWHRGIDGEELRAAFAYAYKNNRTVVVSSGTDLIPGQIVYPQVYPNVIVVGATTKTGGVASFSATGNHVDVTAPGVKIITTSPFNTYASFGGTSAAAPHVSGIASLLKGYNPSLYNDDIENLIKLSADDKGPVGFDPGYGWGRVNAQKALNLLRAPYTLNHYTATGGTAGTPSAQFSMKFREAGTLSDGFKTVKRYALTKNVTFPSNYCQIKSVWGVGYTSTGWRLLNSNPDPANPDPANTNYGMGFTEVVPGTLTNTGATLRTYVYEVFSNGVSVGFYPTTPGNVQFGYSILGTTWPTITPDSYADYNSGGSYQPLYAYNTVGAPTYISALLNLAPGTTSSSAQVIYSSHYSSWSYSFGPDKGYLSFNLDYPNQSISFRVTATNGTCQSFYNVAFNTTDQGMYVYSPNPASDALTIEYRYKEEVSMEKRIKKDFEIKLINNKGEVVRSEKNLHEANKIFLDTHNLPNNTYILHITEGKNVITNQVIISH